MIRAVMYWNQLRLEVEGHAGSAPAGQDLVCAAASMLTSSLIGVLEDAKARGRTEFEFRDNGERMVIHANPGMNHLAEVKSYYRMCIKGLKMLQEQYRQNVDLKEVF